MYSQSGKTKSIHLKGGSQWTYGARTPAILFQPTGEMSVCSAISGNWDECISLSGPPESTWTSINVSQELIGGKFLFRIHVNGQEVHSVENSQTTEFTNVKVFAINGFQKNVLKGFVRNLVIKTNSLGKIYYLCSKLIIT